MSNIKYPIITLILVICYLLLVTPIQAQTDCSTSHEKALCNLNKGTIAIEATPLEVSVWDKFAAKFLEFFGFKLGSPGSFLSRADVGKNSYLPKFETNPDVAKEAQNDLGSSASAGLWNPDIPPEAQTGANNTCQTEKIRSQSWFPEGVDPFETKKDCQ